MGWGEGMRWDGYLDGCLIAYLSVSWIGWLAGLFVGATYTPGPRSMS